MFTERKSLFSFSLHLPCDSILLTCYRFSIEVESMQFLLPFDCFSFLFQMDSTRASFVLQLFGIYDIFFRSPQLFFYVLVSSTTVNVHIFFYCFMVCSLSNNTIALVSLFTISVCKKRAVSIFEQFSGYIVFPRDLYKRAHMPQWLRLILAKKKWREYRITQQ